MSGRGEADSVRGWNMGKSVVDVTLVLTALGMCGACTEVMTVGMDGGVGTVEEELWVEAVIRGGSEERS